MRAFWIGFVCLGTASPAFADDYDLSGLIKPGLWETRTQQTMGDGQPGPVETDQECVTPEEIEDFASFARGEQIKNVTVEEFERGDDFVRYTMSFASDDPKAEYDGTMSGEMEFDGTERYHGTMSFVMSFQGQSMESHSTVDAHRIGECSAED